MADLHQLKSHKSVTKPHLLHHVGRTRHVACIHRPLTAFARHSEDGHTLLMDYTNTSTSIAVKNDIDLCFLAVRRASEYGISFTQFLRPICVPDITSHTDAPLKVGVGGTSDE